MSLVWDFIRALDAYADLMNKPDCTSVPDQVEQTRVREDARRAVMGHYQKAINYGNTPPPIRVPEFSIPPPVVYPSPPVPGSDGDWVATNELRYLQSQEGNCTRVLQQKLVRYSRGGIRTRQWRPVPIVVRPYTESDEE